MATTDRRGVSVSAIDTPSAGVPNANLAIKTACLVATTVNITLAGAQTIDGVAVGANAERVLVWKQTDATTNGLYNASSGNWVRTTDANSNLQWADGLQLAVNSGATWGNRTFILQTSDPITLGSSAIVFAAGLNSNIAVNTTAPLAGGGAVANNPTLSLSSNSSLAVANSALQIATVSAIAHKWVASFNSAGIAQLTQPAVGDLSGPAALTTSSDTNVTLTMSGTPNSALLAGVNLIVAWQGSLPVTRGGTSGTAASGTLLDNITGFASTGIVARTGAGAYTFYAQGQIPGSTTSALASAGNIGELLSATTTAGAAVNLLTSTVTNVASIQLTAGNWDVWGVAVYAFSAATTATLLLTSVNTVSATNQTLASGVAVEQAFASFHPTSDYSLPSGIWPMTVSSTTTAWVTGTAAFATSSAGVYGSIYARRRA